MREWVRLFATGLIWGMLAVILTTGGRFTGEMVPLAFILGIAATISTAAIWNSGGGSQRTEDEIARKAKRNDRVSRLVDKLDEDEVYQLEELLAARRDEEYRERR